MAFGPDGNPFQLIEVPLDAPTPPDEIERVRRYLQVKAESVQFAESVRQAIVEPDNQFLFP